VHNKAARIPPIENPESLATVDQVAEPPLPKRDAILQAGAQVFMQQGFESANMDEVARLAGVSKATIYSHFDGKQDLFGAIITGRCQAMIPVIAALGDQLPAEALRIIGRQFLDLLMSKGPLSLYRVVLSEAGRFPALGRTFYQNGPDKVAAALADYLARQHKAGELDVPEPRVSAEQFFGMVLGQIHVRLLLGVSGTAPGPDERGRIVELAVRTFLDGVGRR
jgi:TetR/AcrR family transcriptional regulator, mexJK operon transcriptional repressor